MQSAEYKAILKTIILNLMKRKFPGLNKIQLSELAIEASRAIHARMYGANVDGVETPIWRDHPFRDTDFSDAQPTKTAQELLND